MRLILFSLLTLRASAAGLNRVIQRTPGQYGDTGVAWHARAAADLRADMSQDWISKLGHIHPFSLQDCETLDACFANNPVSPYGMYMLPQGPRDSASYDHWCEQNIELCFPADGKYEERAMKWRLDADEAVVAIMTTPPRMQYFGQSPYLYSHVRSYWNASQNGVPIALQCKDNEEDPSIPTYCDVFSSTGPTLNNVVMEDAMGHSPFNTNIAVIYSFSRSIAKDVRDALVAGGHIAPVHIFEMYWPGADLNPNAGSPVGDEYTIVQRTAMPEDQGLFDAWLAEPPATLVRLTPRHKRHVRLESWPAAINRDSGAEQLADGQGNVIFTHQEIEDQLMSTIEDFVDKYGSEDVDHRVQRLTNGVEDWGKSCFDTGRRCQGDNVDTPYPSSVATSTKSTLCFRQLAARMAGETNDEPCPAIDFATLSDHHDDFFLMVGALHEKTNKAGYHAISAVNHPRLMGIGSVTGDQLDGSMAHWFGEQYGREHLYAWKFARNCTAVDGTVDRYCTEIPTETDPFQSKILGLPLNSPLLFMERAYMDPSGSIGFAGTPGKDGEGNHVIMPYILHFAPKTLDKGFFKRVVPAVLKTIGKGLYNIMPKPATAATAAANRRVLRDMAHMFADRSDFETSIRGKKGSIPDGKIYSANSLPGLDVLHGLAEQLSDRSGVTGEIGQFVDNVLGKGFPSWDTSKTAFLDTQLVPSEYPDTCNPSLFRMSALNNGPGQDGVFEVVQGIYQVRGYDLSVSTFIRSATGWIVVDPLVGVSNAKAALQLVREAVEDLPIVGLIFTHSHIDHYGGAEGLWEPEEVADGFAPDGVPVIVPEGFMEAVIHENAMAGNAMNRRAAYMYGNTLRKSPTGTLGSGLGLMPSLDVGAGLTPTTIIREDGQTLTVDGVRFTFLTAHGTEAPSEFVFHLPDFLALCIADVATRVMHNLQTLRGAKPRSGLKWSKALQRVLDTFGDDSQVVFASHHWPVWGNDQVKEFLSSQRDLYRFQHDQALRLLNKGYTSVEIANMVSLPASLGNKWYNRPYYGTLKHNLRSQYDIYMGWYDGVPANLDPLPPSEAGQQYIKAFGGIEQAMDTALASFEKGEYRWVAEMMNKIVFGQPDNREARLLLADAYEQLGYQAESSSWRNIYLTGAKEARRGVRKVVPAPQVDQTLAIAPLALVLESLGSKLMPERAEGQQLAITVQLIDTDEAMTLGIVNSVQHESTKLASEPDLLIKGTRAEVYTVLLGEPSAMADVAEKLTHAGKLRVEGDVGVLGLYGGMIDSYEFWFDIVSR